MTASNGYCTEPVSSVGGRSAWFRRSGRGSLVGYVFLTYFGTAKSQSEFLTHTER